MSQLSTLSQSSNESTAPEDGFGLEHGTSRRISRGRVRRQGVFWLLTLPHHDFVPYLPTSVVWIKGQAETGEETGYVHWQVCCAFDGKVSITRLKRVFGNTGHYELTRSDAASEYVWKDATAVPSTRFELGVKPLQANSRVDWDRLWSLAERGLYMEIPARLRLLCYRSIRAIEGDMRPVLPMVRNCRVYWGKTGTGKSRRAWEEAGFDAYPKDPRTKFW